MSNWHTAKQGLVGIGRDGQMVGITCEHVTLSSDGTLFMQSDTGQMVNIGVTNKIGIQHRRALDIDCFKVNENFITFFSKNPRLFKKCKVFKGSLTDLYGKRIFRCSDSTQQGPTENRKYGRVASALDHQMCKDDSIDMTHNLLIGVESPFIGCFATKGNSGDYVAIEEDGLICILGIITSGDYIPSYRKGKPPYTICLLLKTALASLGRKFKEHFASCATLFFKTPDQIEPRAFNLVDRLVLLTDFNIPKVDKEEVKVQLEYEKIFSGKIDSRTDITTALFPADNPLGACIINSVKACASLWDNDMEKAEEWLKNAVRCMPNVGPLLLVMLCKVLVHSAWYFRLVNNPRDAKTILDEGWAFMKEFKENSIFPQSSEFYVYFEYSMHYKGACDHQKATQYSLKAVDHSRKSFTDNPSSATAGNRYMLSVCQYAGIKLKCGDTFETRDLDVSQEDIDDVENCMAEVGSIYYQTDPFAQSFFLLRKCDMLYRKNCIDQALESANKCRDLARKTNIKKDRDEAMCRIMALQEYY